MPLLACQEELPTANQEELIPVDPVTVEVRLPFDEFATNLRVFGGYGGPSELPYGVLAHEYEGSLEARTLIGWRPFPTMATVRDTTGTSRPDSSLVFLGGKMVAFIDTISSVHEGPVDLAIGALPRLWHYASADWQVAVDTVGDRQAWEEPGAGPVTPLATATWDPTESDSVTFELDSAAVALWNDTVSASRGVRIDALTEGVRLQAHTFRLHLTTRPSSNPDTLVDLVVQNRWRTFIYEPVLETPQGELRVGGVPAWRTVFDMDFPTVLNGPPELCQAVECPLELTSESVNSASLYLTTAEPIPGFRPSDTLRIDVREVLQPSRLPKSPLGNSLTGIFGVRIPPAYFGDSIGSRVAIPLAGYIVSLIQADTAGGGDLSSTMALLSSFEPLSLPFASFYGPGSPHEPEIRLILTVGGQVEIK